MTHEHNYECGLGPDHNHSEKKRLLSRQYSKVWRFNC